MKYRKKIRNVLVSALLAFTCIVQINPVTVQAEENYWPSDISTDSPCAIVMEVNTGTVLYEKNADEIHYPASITKIMTCLLTIENCSLDEMVVFSADAVYKNEGDTSHISRDLNEEMTVEQCLYAVMLESANECAYALAEHVGEELGGDYSTFIDLMNERAKELGCTNTHFNNCNGLPDTEHWLSSRDMAIIARAAYLNETFQTIAGTQSYTIPVTNKHDVETPLHNHHNMLYPFHGVRKYLKDYCTGGKTGYTNAANSTLVTYGEKDGITLVCVIMNATSPSHYTDTISLMEYCFNNFQAINISENETSISEESLKNTGVLNNNDSFVTLDQNAYIIIPKPASFTDAKFSLDTSQSSKSDVATLNYTYADRIVGTAQIVTTGATVTDNIFDKNQIEESDNVKLIEIKPEIILVVLLIIGSLLILIFFGKKLYDNLYVIRHNFEVWKARRERFKEVNDRKKRKRKKKDRLFH